MNEDEILDRQAENNQHLNQIQQMMNQATAEQDSNFKERLLELEKEKAELKLRLLGKEVSWIQREDGRWQQNIRDTGDHLINKKGLARIWPNIETLFSLNVLSSRLEWKNVETIGKRNCHAIKKAIYLHRNEYGIEDVTAADQIMAIILGTCMPNLMKGYKGAMLKYLQQTTAHSYIHREGDEKKGGVRGILPW